jgi:hypothetical protein
MNKITFPLKPQMQGSAVGDLQATLQFLLDRAVILGNNQGARRKISVALKREQIDSIYGETTRRAVSFFQREQRIEPSGAVDETTANALNRLTDELASAAVEPLTYTVKGTVRFFDGFPAVGVIVSAFDRDLRSEQVLGQSQTNSLGGYQIDYGADRFLRAEKANADLVVRTFAASGSSLVASPVLFNAPIVAEVDIVIPAEIVQPPSLFEKIGHALAPILDGLTIVALEEDQEHQDLSFLSGETGFDKTSLARFALAHRLARPDLQAEFWFALLGGSFYQFAEDQSLIQQLQVILDALPSLTAAAVRKAMNRGFNQKEISEAFRNNVDGWIESFLRLIAGRLIGGRTNPTFVGLALEDAGITGAAKQEAFARLFNEHKAFTSELFDALENDSSFTDAEISNLSASFQLAELAQSDFSVVSMLKSEFRVSRPQQIRPLAKRSEEQWVTLVQDRHSTGKINIPIEVGEIALETQLPEAEVYGRLLARQFREAFPTTAFVGGIERALQNGGAMGLRRANDLRRFLDGHPNFELLSTPVDEFMNTRVLPDFRELADDQAFRLEVKATQRVFKLAATFEAVDALLADDLHSAQKIYRMGKSEFVRLYAGQPGFSAETATLAWNKAADTHAAALTIVADLKGLDAEGLPLVLKNNNEALSKFPNWSNLFKTGDICECEHCRSALSPAAYFADLLMFLKGRKGKDGEPVKDILFARRPDLGFLELNCENALTPLPYIDVVCEVLEAAVDNSGENDLELPGFTAIPAAAAKAAVAAAFAAQGISLGADFSLSQVDPTDPDHWVAHGDDVTYLLKKKPPSLNFFAEVLRNTKTSAAELRAYPQYVNPRAYEKLREARYPLDLPFDLFAEEVRAAFQKTNLQRWDLMGALRGSAAPNNATDGEIAAEYFGISADPDAAFDEKRLILTADVRVAGQRTLWGETGADWLSRVGNVKNFLRKTSLEYNDLLALLDLQFINPAGDIAIHHLDPSCDTDKKVIQVLDATKLDRIHRFLRLWRKLKGWKMWELDLVIRHPRIGAGALNESFLVDLFYFSRLRNRLGAKTTVEQVCALFGDLNTETRFTRLHEKREDALYQSLFLNKRLINPLDPAFNLDPDTGDLPAGETISAHHPVAIAALSVREDDLALLKELTRASDGALYITDDLTLGNLSFLWRHAWLSKLLKFKAEEWKTILKIFGQDILRFSSPEAAWSFVEKVDHVKAAGFTPDELNWLLAADRSAKAAVKEADAARFLATLRKELQAIQAEYDPAQYDFFAVTPPTDVDGLSALLTSLLQKLNRDELAAITFLKTLRGSVSLEAPVQGLPQGFTFPAVITAAPNHIPIHYDEPGGTLRFTGLMSEAQRTILLSDELPATVTENSAYTNAIGELFERSQSAADDYVAFEIEVALPGGVILPGDRPSLPIRYNSTTQKLGFIGVMPDAERLALQAAGNPAGPIDELFRLPRLAVKFYEPVFTAPLDKLPPAVDFKAQLPADLAGKISFDIEQRSLRFAGAMMNAEQEALNALVPNALPEEAAYHIAINSLATQPQAIALPDRRIWLTDDDLDPTPPANDTLAKRAANAALKALDYLSKTLAANTVVQQSGAQLGLTEAVTRRLLDGFAILPPILPDPSNTTLLGRLTRVFAATTGAVDYATQKTAFGGWFWANRVAAILKKWKIEFADWEKIIGLTSAAQLLDLLTLPLDDAEEIASIDRFLRTHRLLRLRDSLPETQITLLEIMEKLNDGVYAAAAAGDPSVTEQELFSADIEILNEAWPAAQTQALIAALDLAFPSDYLLAESWERLRRAFYFLENLNAGAEIVRTFAAAAMTFGHAKTLKELLRSKFGEETWLTLSAEIQDVLRERKRDALAAYLLTQPPPDEVPSGKWENTNDLYAYYLLDVEMSACMLTSRLVQGSGSIQLLVQRCFMGLEPNVVVQADGDDGNSAWRWWKWMRKYRVWEANLKVYFWPENWIEPELKKDRSSFFKDLENELLQNEIDQYTVETAFTNYLEKLDGVAQLEIAGFYQEDDGDNTIIHVFGRTKGAEPHLYYYRRYDYRQWSPWEKVDLDIQGDYLIPAVINKRLFLFWPVFTEAPDEETNGTVSIPQPDDEVANLQPANKKLRLQMAVSDYRQGKWTPKRISKDMVESTPYNAEIVRKHYQFFAIDGTEIDGRFVIKFGGISVGRTTNQFVAAFDFAPSSTFEITGCSGVPEQTSHLGNFEHVTRPEYDSVGNFPASLKWVELGARHDPQHDFTLQNILSASRFRQVLEQTPGIFKVSPPWHLSYFDRLHFDGQMTLASQSATAIHILLVMGTWLPFFYNDKKRTFFVLPAFRHRANIDNRPSESGVRSYYPEIKRAARELNQYCEKQVQEWLEGIDLSTLTGAERRQLEESLRNQLDEEALPPYTNEQVKELAKRWLMRFFHIYISALSLYFFQFRAFHFKNFYHPFVCDFAKLVYNPLKGIPALMSRETQLKNTGFRFKQNYQPTPLVVEWGTEKFYPKEDVDFTPDGAYSPYNWELFFHAPLLIANSLSKNQRFEEARDWYHFIFNPVGVESGAAGSSSMSKYWITKPFFETTGPQYVQQRIDNILRMLAGDVSAPGYSEQAKSDLEAQVTDWRTNPFEPHRIANYRTVAYQKTVVMKYLDNLIAWGDYLFRQDSMESVNEATQLYIMAAEILGPRPKKVPPQARPPVESFNELENQFDALSNALVEVENLIPMQPGNGPEGADPSPLPMLYFCIPQNDKLLGYWDTVADRLFKIRHCMNIEGVVRQLALFEPPIDPGALVKAVAGGIDISSALADLNAPLPLYRFNALLQKANEVCNDVKALGGALLAALEKKDAEALTQLRQEQEIRVLESVKAVRKQQIDEAKENLEGVKKSKELAEIRKKFYESRDFMNAGETAAIVLSGISLVVHDVATGMDILGGILAAIPDFDVGVSGFGGTPTAKVKTGGISASKSIELAARALYQISGTLDKSASIASTVASYQRRKDDWDHQRDLAIKEIEQIDESIAAAELRIAIAEKELENHNLQIENAKATDEFMRSKYTNQELYQWQIGQISDVYFQSYKLAYDLAKRAERCFRFELGLQDSSYIQFGYWDSLKKGLLSGEKLQYDLRRLETAYLEQNRREFELSKHISLALLDPLALVKLRETGRCFINLPEEIFDLDFPGHYFRRIKSVSITLPCVAGPYTTISCTLRLLKNSIRVNTANGDNGYLRNTDEQGLPVDDSRFIENNIPVKAIAASNAQNDSGVFELSFRDERYLPFEGAGAVSEWSLELFSDLPANNPDPGNPDFGKPLRQFDYGTISDAILHVKYTAREDAGPFKNAAITHLRDYFSQDEATPSLRLFNLRQEFPTQWHRFLHPTNPTDGNVFELEMSPNLFPFRDHGKTLKINTIWLFARRPDAGNFSVIMTPPLPEPPPAGSNTMTLAPVNQYGGLHFSQKDVTAVGIEIVPTAPPVKWQLRMLTPGSESLQVDDLLLALGYEWS